MCAHGVAEGVALTFGWGLAVGPGRQGVDCQGTAGHGLFGAGVAAAHDAASCGHTDVRPVKSMSNFVMSALSSDNSVVSRTCRERDASIALTMSGSMLPRQTSYFPARNADPPAVLSG